MAESTSQNGPVGIEEQIDPERGRTLTYIDAIENLRLEEDISVSPMEVSKRPLAAVSRIARKIIGAEGVVAEEWDADGAFGIRMVVPYDPITDAELETLRDYFHVTIDVTEHDEDGVDVPALSLSLVPRFPAGDEVDHTRE